MSRQIILFIIIFSISFISDFSRIRIINGMHYKEVKKIKLRFGFTCFSGVLIGLLAFYNIPLPLFYIIFYINSCLMIVIDDEFKKGRFFIANMRFLMNATFHLIFLGMLSLIYHSNIQFLLEDVYLRCFSAGIILLWVPFLDLCIFYLLKRKMKEDIRYSNDEVQIYPQFLWFCIGFIIMDSVPCLFELPYVLVAQFLIASNFLLLLMLLFSVIQIFEISINSYLEEKYYRILNEKKQQALNTEVMKKIVYKDSLTGTYTRRYAMENMLSLIEAGMPFVLAYLDLDQLKKINDNEGHLAGDQYLLDFTSVFQQKLRKNDIFARIGGDEFVVIMPECAITAARERFLQIQSELDKTQLDKRNMLFSFGIIEVPSFTHKTVSELLDEADHQMYQNKTVRRKGGNENGTILY